MRGAVGAIIQMEPTSKIFIRLFRYLLGLFIDIYPWQGIQTRKLPGTSSLSAQVGRREKQITSNPANLDRINKFMTIVNKSNISAQIKLAVKSC